MNKLILLPVIVIIAVIGFLSIPSEPTNSIVFEIPDTNESKIVVGDVELIVNNDDIVPVTIIDQIFESPDLTIPIDSELPPSILNEIQYSFEEENTLNDITINEYELFRTITFNDGSTDEQSTFTQLQALDFIALDNDVREINKGKISFKLTVPVQKPIRLAQSEFTVNYVDSNNNVKKIKNIFNTKTQSDVKDGMIVLLDDDIQFDSILETSSLGKNKLIVTLDKLFIIYDDNSREYASPNTLYSAIIEKSNAQYIIKNESGVMVKLFDFDVPITISSNKQSITSTMCLSRQNTGGCAWQHSSGSTIPAPAMGSVTITNIKSGEIVAQMDSVNKGSCTTDYRFNIFSNQAYCSQNNYAVGGYGGSSLGYLAQRGQSYEINISDPLTSWIIDIPITGGEYKYSCIADQGTQQGSSTGRTCNFPQ